MLKFQKYFGYVSYNGKFFHGSQIQKITPTEKKNQIETVQENLIVFIKLI